MTQEVIERVAKMLDSGNFDMENLARNIFWSGNPSQKDYADLSEARGGIRYMDSNFPHLKEYCIRRFCGKETYESIYGKGTFG